LWKRETVVSSGSNKSADIRLDGPHERMAAKKTGLENYNGAPRRRLYFRKAHRGSVKSTVGIRPAIGRHKIALLGMKNSLSIKRNARPRGPSHENWAGCRLMN
jgi:hypothetical protein